MRPPPGYPFAGDIPSRPLDPLPEEGEGAAGRERARGALGATLVLMFAGAMMGAGFMLVGLMSAEARHHRAVAAETAEMTVDTLEPSSKEIDSRMVDTPTESPPPVVRNVPVFPARFLEGCSAGDLDTVETVLTNVIGEGAPLYNSGDVEGCADVYERGARELEAALPATCKGPQQALADGRASANRIGHANGRAWALRDAFDGLIEVLDRSRAAGVSNL